MSTATLSLDAITYVCSLVRQRAAIELDASKDYLIEARLNPLARRHGFPSATQLVADLQSRPDSQMQKRVVEAMTTNETSFFRDGHPFECLRTAVLPELIARHSARRTLNIWSAACSTGQEVYSIAMLLRDGFPAAKNWGIKLMATDICDEVLDRARRGSFTQIEVNRGLPARLLAIYFRRRGVEWELAPEIREMVQFSKLNLIEAWPPLPAMDIVFLRNVLIYFSAETKRLILSKVRGVLSPGGILFLGGAETTMGLDANFERMTAGNQTFYRLK